MIRNLPGRFILPSGALDFPETRGFPGSENFVSKSKSRYSLTMLQNYMKNLQIFSSYLTILNSCQRVLNFLLTFFMI